MFVVTIANLLGAPMYDASLDATDIINFETELAKVRKSIGNSIRHSSCHI